MARNFLTDVLSLEESPAASAPHAWNDSQYADGPDLRDVAGLVETANDSVNEVGQLYFTLETLREQLIAVGSVEGIEAASLEVIKLREHGIWMDVGYAGCPWTSSLENITPTTETPMEIYTASLEAAGETIRKVAAAVWAAIKAFIEKAKQWFNGLGNKIKSNIHKAETKEIAPETTRGHITGQQFREIVEPIILTGPSIGWPGFGDCDTHQIQEWIKSGVTESKIWLKDTREGTMLLYNAFEQFIAKAKEIQSAADAEEAFKRFLEDHVPKFVSESVDHNDSHYSPVHDWINGHSWGIWITEGSTASHAFSTSPQTPGYTDKAELTIHPGAHLRFIRFECVEYLHWLTTEREEWQKVNVKYGELTDAAWLFHNMKSNNDWIGITRRIMTFVKFCKEPISTARRVQGAVSTAIGQAILLG